MRTYQEGKSYELDYVGTIDINDRKYLCVTDGENDYTVVPYDYQLDWPDQIPDTLICYVKDLTISGKPRFIQDRYAVLKNRYPQIGINYSFYITSIIKNVSGTITGYRLSDPYGITHYIPARLMPVGFTTSDTVTLLVKDIVHDKDNNSKLLLQAQKDEHTIPYISRPRIHTTIVDTVEYEEGEKVEFKTSIVYLAATSAPDPNEQGKVIMQTIAGFMNNEGGKLLIGVNDNGEIVGINNDIEYLFPNRIDNIHDKYELVIRNRINICLGPIPNTKVHIKFISGKNTNLEYVLIDVDKSEEPVFVYGTDIFVRAGNMTVHLKNNHVISFIVNRVGHSENTHTVPTLVWDSNEDVVSTAPENNTTNVDEELNAIIPTKRQEKKHEIKIHNLADEENIIGHLYFLKNGACQYLTNKQESQSNQIPDYVYKTPIPSTPKNYNLLIFYSNGNTDIINLESALFGTGRNCNKKKAGLINPGWNTEFIILDAFCVKNTNKNANLITYISKLDGQRFIKLHEMSAIAKQPHKQFGNIGNQMLAKGAELLYVISVSGDTATKNILAQNGLIRPDSYKTLCGTPIKKITGQNLEILKPLLEKFEDVPASVTIPTTELVQDSGQEPVETSNITALQVIQTQPNLFTCLFIITQNGEVVKTLTSNDGSAVSNIPFKYENLVNLCDRRFPELENDVLTFVKFTYPIDKFDKELAKDIISFIYSGNQDFLDSGKEDDYQEVAIETIANEFQMDKKSVFDFVSNGYFLTENGSYPLYDDTDHFPMTV